MAVTAEGDALCRSCGRTAALGVSKYARGGSARKLSARRFYIAVDALQVAHSHIFYVSRRACCFNEESSPFCMGVVHPSCPTCAVSCCAQGHLASNGYSPFPKNKIPVLLSNVRQARDLIAQGK